MAPSVFIFCVARVYNLKPKNDKRNTAKIVQSNNYWSAYVNEKYNLLGYNVV
jgi:hypothetical protein